MIANLSLNQTLLTFLLCKRNLDDSIDSGSLSVRGYLPLMQKDSSTHMHTLGIYAKEGLPFARDLSLENYADFYLCLQLALLQCVLLLFPMSITFFILVHSFYFISSNIDKVLSINRSTAFVFGDFHIHHKNWFTYSAGTDRSGELCYNVPQIYLLRWLIFLLGSQTVIVTVLLFWIYFFLLTLVFVLQCFSLH